jgi:hypothetical protein
MKVNSFKWIDYGDSMRVNWWNINIELVIDDNTYNLNIIREEYLDEDGGGKGGDYRVIDNSNNEILYNGLWKGWSRYEEVEGKMEDEWKIGDSNGMDIWFKIEEEVENDNGWGFWDNESVDEDYLKEFEFEL